MTKGTLTQYNPQQIDGIDSRICLKGSCIANLPADILEPGPGQRGITGKIKQMTGEEKYDPLGFRPLSVSHGIVGGKEFYFITDGLQRYTAITRTFGKDIKIPCFVVENLSEADQKYALFLMNHNASVFSDKNKLWQNAVESGRDILRKKLTELFISYQIGIRGYDYRGEPINGRKHSSGRYFEQGDLLMQYVFGENGRMPIAGGRRGFEVEMNAVQFALEMITKCWNGSQKKTDDIIMLGLAYFYAKNDELLGTAKQATEKCKKMIGERTPENIVDMAVRVIRLKEMLDTGKDMTSQSRGATSWHGPVGAILFSRMYEKAYPKEKRWLYRGYIETQGGKEAMFSYKKYKGIPRMLNRF